MTETQSKLLAKYDLSPRQLEVAEMMLQGLKNEDIANKMFVTIKTIKFHVGCIYKKAKVKRRKDFVALATNRLPTGQQP